MKTRAKKKSDKIRVTVVVVPTSGKPTERTVVVAPKGMTVRDVLEEAEVSAKDRDLTLNGKPATVETPVESGSEIQVKHRVTVEERPAGS